jgi:uracil-DNA glycosylase
MDVSEIRVVILGQDPYHNEGQAHGLSFSVQKGVAPPPSIKNIFKELTLEFPERNYAFPHGCLQRWTDEEKIFLLNASLTVRKNQPKSHIQLWEEFTDEVIEYIFNHNKTCVFLLMGQFARSKEVFIRDKSRIVSCSHPSPLATGFIGSNVFKAVEMVLKSEINWNI